MLYIAIGVLGFLVIHTFDFVALKKVPVLKPVVWLTGSGLLAYAMVMVCLAPEKLALPTWGTWLGWVLLIISLLLLLYSLFINLPLRKTYLASGIGDKLVKTGLYALVRHPGVMWFTLVMVSLVLVAKTQLTLIAAPLFITLDVVLVVVQDKFFFVRMFTDYKSYQRETPMLIPNRRSIRAFVDSLKQAKS